MKSRKLYHAVFAVIIVSLLAAGCSKKSDNPVAPNPNPTTSGAQLVLNGAGYTNQSATFGNGLCGYSVQDSITAVYFDGVVNGDTLQLYILFKGNHTGTYTWDQDNGAAIYSMSSTFIGLTQGSTTISKYGSVGDKVEGSLNGKLYEASTQAELNINGTFSAVRITDTP